MAGLSLFVDVDSAKTVRKITQLEAILSPPSLGAFLGGVVDPYIRSRAKARFQGEGDDVVGEWLPLATATQSIRADMGYGPSHPINRRTGQLEDYITKSPERITMFAGGASLVSPGNPPTGELRKKVRTAQVGDEGSRTRARPVIGINERDLAFAMSALQHFVTEGLK